MINTLKKIKVVIIVLSILLGLSLLALAGVMIHGRLAAPSNGSAVAPDNYINPSSREGRHTDDDTPWLLALPALVGGESTPNTYMSGRVPLVAYAKTVISSSKAEQTVISIYKNKDEDSTQFKLDNMFPGDSETQSYVVEVSHVGTVTVRFHADIVSTSTPTKDGETLADVLECKIEILGEEKPLYEGLMRDMHESLNYQISSVFSTTTKLTYMITVYLDKSVTSAYMGMELTANFCWWVEESGSTPTPPPAVTTEAVITPGPGPGGNTEPEVTTGPEEVTTGPEEETTGPEEETTGPEEETTGPEEVTTGPEEVTTGPEEETTGPEEETTGPEEETTGPEEETTGPEEETTGPAEEETTGPEEETTDTYGPGETTAPEETTEAEWIPGATTTTEETETDDGKLVYPFLTVNSPFFIIAILLILIILFIIILLLWKRRKKDEEEEEGEVTNEQQ